MRGISVGIDREKTMSLPLEIREGKLVALPIAGDVPEPEPEKLKNFIQSKLSFKTLPDKTIVTPPLDVKEEKAIGLWFDDNIFLGKITASASGLVLEQSERSLLNATEIRKSINSSLSPLATLPPEEKIYDPKTDLHTHFAAIMTADILLAAIKKKYNDGKKFQYPINLLKEIGVNLRMYFESDEEYNLFIKNNKTFDITQFFNGKFTDNPENKANIAKLRNTLHIPRDKTIIFAEMEKYYVFRDPLVKDIDLFSFYLEEIAKDYQRQGITYAEISWSKVIDPAWLKIIDEKVPELEKKYGVAMRWLSPIARVLTSAKRDTQVELFKNHASKSPYIIGVDVLAAEINSTYDLFPQLIDVAEWAKANFPNMVIRVHAGEYSYHPENIEGVVMLAEKYLTECPTLRFRVGHGVYKGHKDVFKRAQLLPNLVSEINMASNQALNSIGDIGGHTLFEYARKGLPVVLGSDGHGLYQTDPQDLIKLLSYGDPPIDIPAFCQQLKKIEDEHMAYVTAVTQERMTLFQRQLINILHTLPPSKEPSESKSAYQELAKELGIPISDSKTAAKGPLDPLDESEKAIFAKAKTSLFKPGKTFYDTAWDQLFSKYNADKARYDAEDKARSAKEQEVSAARREEVRLFCQSNGIQLVSDRISSPTFDMPGKTPIMLAGMIEKLEIAANLGNLKEVEAFIKTLLATLDPNLVYFVTSGKDIGIQKMVHELVHEHNQANQGHPEKQFALAGILPADTTKDELSPHLTHAVIVEDISTVYNLYEYIAKLLKHNQLKYIVAGGNMLIKDIIQIADNVIRDPHAKRDPTKAQQLFLMTQIEGASKIKSEELPKEYRFTNFVQVLMRMNQPNVLFQNKELTEQQVAEIFATMKMKITDDVDKHQGRIQASTPSEIAGKIITSLVELPKFKKLPSDLQLDLKNQGSMMKFIEMCRNKDNAAVTNTKIYGCMAAEPTIAFQFAALATLFEIPLPESITRQVSKVTNSERLAIDALIKKQKLETPTAPTPTKAPTAAPEPTPGKLSSS